jgi:hypothetical protein
MNDDHEIAGRSLLVGRDRELDRIDEMLQRRRSALIVVSAVAGMGKTSLLRTVEARARGKGWRTAPGDGEVEHSILPTTTEETFRERVLTLLGISTEETFIAIKADPSRLSPFDPLVEQLRRAPILLLIDGYRPDPGFASWFTGRFIGDVRQAGASVVVIVAGDQFSNVEELRPFADETIVLGPLDRQAVEQHFRLVGQRVAPPMEAAELDVYVEASCKDPVKLASLTHALALAQPGEGSASPSVSTMETINDR